MPILSLHVPQRFVDHVNEKLRRINSNPRISFSINDLGREALTRLKWEIDQMLDGRAVVATDLSRRDMIQLSTPAIPARPPQI